jgi:hypothetical protein
MILSSSLNSLFDSHVDALGEAKKRRREDLALRGALEVYNAPDGTHPGPSVPAGGVGGECDEDPQYGLALPEDVYEGDAHLRTLNRLLAVIDAKGFERSSQQVDFHQAFTMATGRVLYKADWSLHRPDICERNKWSKSFGGEVMISTPRRFGCAAISQTPIAASPSLMGGPARFAERRLLLRCLSPPSRCAWVLKPLYFLQPVAPLARSWRGCALYPFTAVRPVLTPQRLGVNRSWNSSDSSIVEIKSLSSIKKLVVCALGMVRTR